MKKIKDSHKTSRILLAILISLLIFSLGYISGFIIYRYKTISLLSEIENKNIQQESQNNIKYSLIDEVVNQLRLNYIDKDLNFNKISYGMAEGIVNSLNDKYTMFLNPEENTQYKDDRTPALEGIGVVLIYNGDYTEIESVLDKYPAFLGGVQAKDIVLEVDGEIMKDQKPSYVSSKIKGKSGTKVKLKLLRVESGDTIDLTLERTKIEIKNIDYKELDNNIYHVRVSRFIDESVEDFNKEWDKIVSVACQDGDNRLVLDLRNNPGGYVNSALYMLEDFLPNNSLLMKEIDRDGNESTKYSQRDPRCKENKVVVLINSSSASASEIFAGGLQDYGRAYLIGEETVGKGLEQKVVDLSDGSAMHIVFRKWTTPKGFNPTPESPIKPDQIIEIIPTETEDETKVKDVYIEKSIEYFDR
ncbi:hypothetical protein KBD45_00270 [Candidatus Dojkabacteria bacterium]|nr:hypothetical protein [Candidatus Dojkabacteria bacterium]